jgi:NADH/F420H2 dehydrogenase subunit C
MTTEPTEIRSPGPPYDDLASRFDSAEFEVSHGQVVVRVPREDLVGFVDAAKVAGFRMFIDLCGVDYLDRDPRFEVVVNLLSLEPPRRIRILVGVPGDDPTAPSITGVFPGADFYERETFDLFGIEFEGHPDLTRILLPDDWVGFPLRKDAPIGSVPVQFKGSTKVS